MLHTRLQREARSRSLPAMSDEPLDRLRALLTDRALPGVTRPRGARDAAVGVILRAVSDPEVLLIRRAERHGDPWSGHMALPGGLRAAGDPDLAHTFVRETREETSITLRLPGSLLGALDPVAPSTARLPPIVIAPFVATVPAGTPATPDQREVVDAFWIPLSFLRDVRNTRDYIYQPDPLKRRFPSVQYGEHVIWGLTHRILLQFLDVANEAGL